MSSVTTGKQAIIWFAVIALGFAGACYALFVLTPQREAHSKALMRVPASSVVRVLVKPTGGLHSIRESMELTDRESIAKIMSALASAQIYHPNHPKARWECQLCLETPERMWRLKLSDTENQGLLAYVASGATVRSDGLRLVRQLLSGD